MKNDDEKTTVYTLFPMLFNNNEVLIVHNI